MTVTAMAALGSSFASGPGLAPFADARAMRSERNYAHLAAQALGVSLVDVTVGGATTDTILSRQQRLGLRRFPPQVEAISPGLDLVTITAGGNDLGYLGSIMKAAMVGRLGGHRLGGPRVRRLRSGGPVPVTVERVAETAAGLASVVAAVAERAPRARIVLVDYLTIIGPETGAGSSAPFTDAERAVFRRTGEQLAEAFATVERTTRAELVRVSEISDTHAFDAVDPWVNGLRLGFAPARLASSFHPNAAGMAAVADAVVEHVNGVASRG